MRRLLLFVVLFVALVPRPAAADDMDWWRWWDGLSGPGPFNGLGIDSPFVSYGIKRDPPGTKRTFFRDVTGFEADPEQLHVRVGAEWAFLIAQKNSLPYAPPRDQNPPGVYAFTVLGGVDV